MVLPPCHFSQKMENIPELEEDDDDEANIPDLPDDPDDDSTTFLTFPKQTIFLQQVLHILGLLSSHMSCNSSVWLE